MWEITSKADPCVARLADQHYNRQKPGTRQFCPPGRTLVLYLRGSQWPFLADGVWVWWHPHGNSPVPRMDGFQNWWNCSLFRNCSQYLASDLIKEAVDIVNQECGLPIYGYDTYVWPD
jgi:hypothetical protein